MKRFAIGLAVVTVTIAVALYGLIRITDEPEHFPDPELKTAAANDTKSSRPQKPTDVSSLVVGTWEDDYQGGRRLTRNADGSDVMVVHLEGFAKRLYAEKLTFHGRWRIEGDQLHVESLGGEPARHVQLVLKMMGSSKTQTIVKVTQSEMVLEDQDGTVFRWRRVLDESKAKSK